MLYPKNRAENLDYRARVLEQCSTDPQFAGAILEMCRNDILFWINTLCWVYEPRTKRQQELGITDAHCPFITWDFQDDVILELLETIKNQEDYLMDKSRDMGASWIVVSIFLYMWLFGGSGNDYLIGSRKAEYVDKKGHMDTLFEKMRYQLTRQPEFILPVGYETRLHDTYMSLRNPETGSFIKGESNNQFFGTSGRYKATLLDEFAKWEHTDASAWQSLSDTSDCRIAVSSANGANNHFYRLRFGKVGNIKVKTLLWKLHPHKDIDWYSKEKARRSAEDLGAEVDIDYSASVGNKAYPKFTRSIHVTDRPLYATDLPIDLCCDFNIDPMSWAMCHNVHGESWYFDELSRGVTTTADVIKEFCETYRDHVEKVINIYGDASGRAGSTRGRDSDYDIITTILEAEGWDWYMYVPLSNGPQTERMNAMNKRLYDYENDGKAWILVNEKCDNTIMSLEQTKRTGTGIDKTGNVEHMTDAVGYRENYLHPISPDYIGTDDLC